MLDSSYHMKLKLLKSHFCHENVKILPPVMFRYNGRHYIMLKKSVSILLHGVISLPDATSCDKMYLETSVFLL